MHPEGMPEWSASPPDLNTSFEAGSLPHQLPTTFPRCIRQIHRTPWAYRSAVEFTPRHTMGSPRSARPTHGYAWRTLRVHEITQADCPHAASPGALRRTPPRLAPYAARPSHCPHRTHRRTGRTDAPTHRRTDAPTHRRTDAPTHRRTDAPTHRRTDAPTHRRTDAPTHRRTDAPDAPDAPTPPLTPISQT